MTDDDRTRDPDAAPDDAADDAAHPLELALRHGLRYSGLRDVDLDPRLLLYVPLDVCEREAVLPISVDEELLEVATAFPDPDLETIEGRFPELEIELVFAPIERINDLQDDLREEG
jgi:Type II secretion system (T2SS), protein E, N-terminal domain